MWLCSGEGSARRRLALCNSQQQHVCVPECLQAREPSGPYGRAGMGLQQSQSREPQPTGALRRSYATARQTTDGWMPCAALRCLRVRASHGAAAGWMLGVVVRWPFGTPAAGFGAHFSRLAVGLMAPLAGRLAHAAPNPCHASTPPPSRRPRHLHSRPCFTAAPRLHARVCDTGPTAPAARRPAAPPLRSPATPGGGWLPGGP
jgi:hypothetical protein